MCPNMDQSQPSLSLHHDIVGSIISCRVADMLGGKGGGRKGRYQGKASRMENHKQAEDFLKNSLVAQRADT